jgi:hypothetical protein
MQPRATRRTYGIVAGLAGLLAAPAAVCAQALPDAPTPQLAMLPALHAALGPGCGNAPGVPLDVVSTSAGPPVQPTAQQDRPGQRETRPGFPPVSPQPTRRPSYAPRQNFGIPSEEPQCIPETCVDTVPRTSCAENSEPFVSFIDSTYPHPLTPRQKARLAFRNSVDPFNFATIGFLSAVSVASDPGSPYGPGFPGLGRNIGVSYTETVVGEFFGTFLIPALAHEDPHYHRLPNASFQRRFIHAITQVAWTESDYGDYMVNYSILAGTPITDTIGDLYIPGRQENFKGGLARWATAIATDPIDNFVTEFLPDVASHINLRIVLLQRVINEVAVENGGGGAQ